MADRRQSRLPSISSSVWLGRFLEESLRTSWEKYHERSDRLRTRPTAKAVHDFRVESRRLLSKLEVVACVLSAGAVREVGAIIKRRLNEFDRLRDAHVQIVFLRKWRKKSPKLRPLLKELARREIRLSKKAAQRAKDCSVVSVRRGLKSVQKELRRAFRDEGANHSQRRVVRRAVDRAFRRVVWLRQRIDAADSETIHRTRVAFKKFRYMVQSLRPALSGVDRPRLAAMHAYQSTMGDIQDVEVLTARIHRLIERGRVDPKPLARLRKDLAAHRKILIRKYLKSADDLLGFWKC